MRRALLPLLAVVSFAVTAIAISPAVAATAPDAVVGVPFSHNYGNGNPAWTYSISPSAPPGLQLNSSGVLSGTPTQAGTFSFSISGQSAPVCTVDPNTGERTCSAGGSIQEVDLVVAAAPLTTALTASRATETVTRQGQLSISGLQATLGTPSSGPLADATVVFTAKKSGRQLCTAVTDDNGLASCPTVLLSPSVATAKLAAELALFGYTATYAGTPTTKGSTASAKVVPQLP
jgi:large repetitive protein